jgi:hypothetical protein
MKKSELTSFIKEEIIDILEMENAKDIEDKADAQADLNKELEKTAKITKSMGMEEDATPKGEDFFYDYLDIGMSYLEGFGKKHSLDDSQLEKLGKKIVDQLYKGDVGKAYDAIVKRGAMKENEDKEPSKSDLKKTKGLAKAKEELAQLTKQMKSLARKYKKAEGEEKEKLVADLKKKTKLKKELEAIIDK